MHPLDGVATICRPWWWWHTDPSFGSILVKNYEPNMLMNNQCPMHNLTVLLTINLTVSEKPHLCSLRNLTVLATIIYSTSYVIVISLVHLLACVVTALTSCRSPRERLDYSLRETGGTPTVFNRRHRKKRRRHKLRRRLPSAYGRRCNMASA